ncbi:hypothetical protein KCU78_g15219, partial [Aureobasidium melanogenum]
MLDHEPQGYHRLADLMGQYSETAIFRRFGVLNAITLLSLQAELIDLQVQFRDIWAEDDRSDDSDEQQFSTYFRKLRESGDSIQYEMLQEIRAKLREYNDAMIQAATISRMPSPQPADIKFLRDWLKRSGGGANFLHGSEELTWSLPGNSSTSEKRFLDKDLMTLHIIPDEQDAFSKVLSSSLLSLWNFLRTFRWNPTSSKDARFEKTIDSDDGIMHYSQEGLLKFNNMLISVIGAAMPIVSIVALYFIKTEGGRIGAMAGCTILFAFVLATCTNARRLEIAASTAAFAAVEVVFIGSNLGNP